jgi:hypothetical protein
LPPSIKHSKEAPVCEAVNPNVAEIFLADLEGYEFIVVSIT